MTSATQHHRLPRPENVLPHRDNWLLLADLIEVAPQSLVAYGRAFSAEELAGHFPGAPIVPGALLVELMAQAAGALSVAGPGRARSGGVGHLAAVERAVFLRPLRPDTTPRVVAELVARDDRTVTATCEVSEPGQGIVCRARVRIALPVATAPR